MTDCRPAPYPADTRAKGWRFELDYEQIEQSDTWDLAGEVPMAQHALLMMWLVAWRQDPCGSLPNDEAVIRAKCRIPASVWESVSSICMRGWWQADDGRLYHDTISARVLEMLEYRRKNAQRVAKFKAAQRDSQAGNALPQSEPQANNDTGTGTIEVSKATPSHPPADAAGTKAPTVPCPYDAIVAVYHDTLPSLPRVRLMPVKRQAALRKLWGWILSSRKSDGARRAESADEALAWLRGYFTRASENDFLMGRGARSAEHAGWQCDLDFLLTDKGMLHVIEKTQDAA